MRCKAGKVKLSKSTLDTPKMSKSTNRVLALGDQNGSAERVTISAPNMRIATFAIKGTAPLVIHRFSKKVKDSIIADMKLGSTSKKGKKRQALDPQSNYEEARYRSPDGWDGFNASSLRCALISACRLVGYKMTLAKLSLFVIEDGRDKDEPEYGLIRIFGTPRMLESMGRLDNGSICPIHRPIFDEWSAKIRIRFDADQFSLKDVSNLLMRVGAQVGLGEGRPDSKNSAGMGWGTFEIVGEFEK